MVLLPEALAVILTVPLTVELLVGAVMAVVGRLGLGVTVTVTDLVILPPEPVQVKL
jgi:hypothetical protein